MITVLSGGESHVVSFRLDYILDSLNEVSGIPNDVLFKLSNENEDRTRFFKKNNSGRLISLFDENIDDVTDIVISGGDLMIDNESLNLKISDFPPGTYNLNFSNNLPIGIYGKITIINNNLNGTRVLNTEPFVYNNRVSGKVVLPNMAFSRTVITYYIGNNEIELNYAYYY